MRTVWSWFGLVALAGLSGVHVARTYADRVPDPLIFALGWLPSFFAVPAVTFVVLGTLPAAAVAARRWQQFVIVVGLATTGLVAWEVAQLWLPGNFSFNAADLVATACGGVICVAANSVAERLRKSTQAEAGAASGSAGT